MEKIFIFWGTKDDFEHLVSGNVEEYETITPFMEVIQDYNARVRPNAALNDEDRKSRFDVDNLVVESSDYSSVLEHVIYNFVNVITLNHDINKLFLHNPPNTIVRAINTLFDSEMIYESSTQYNDLDRELIKEVAKRINSNIIGQDIGKKDIVSNMYKLCNVKDRKPIVLLLLGPSGVGKTETAKEISRALGGELMRIQFSMMQNLEAYNYVFGSEHSKNCFARDLLERKTNMVLIDEFDKVSPQFYNAFYQLFDEGIYVDSHYQVDAKNCVFICTSNFKNQSEAIQCMGAPIYSRFTDVISFNELSKENKIKIVKNYYQQCLKELSADEKEIFVDNDILQFFVNNVARFDNVRIIRSKMEKAIYGRIVQKFIYEVED